MRLSFKAIATLVGTTIGAGMFGIPFVVSKIGFLPGLLYILILGFLVLVLNLLYGEIILRTPGDHQLSGYAGIYLGNKGKTLAILAHFITLYGALLAYLIKIGHFSHLIFGIGSPTLFTVLFFIIGAGAIYFGLKAVSAFETLMVAGLLGLVFLIGFLGLDQIKWANLSGLNLSYFFLPYGVILFALTGISAVPELEQILRKEHHRLKRAILIGSLIPPLIYILFSGSVLGISGTLTSDDAISGLIHFLPTWIVNLGAGLGILCMGSSFLSLGFVLREIWFRELKVSKKASFIAACFPSLILFFLGAKSFIQVLEFTGALAMGFLGILVLSIYGKAKREGQRKPAFSLSIPQSLIFLLYLIFLIGMISPFL